MLNIVDHVAGTSLPTAPTDYGSSLGASWDINKEKLMPTKVYIVPLR